MIETNFFGLPRFNLHHILSDQTMSKSLASMLENWLSYLDAPIGTIIDSTIKSIGDYSLKTGLVEAKLKQEYIDAGVFDRIRCNLDGRTRHVYDIVAPFLGKNIIDYGCGPGAIAYMIHENTGRPIQLADVVDARYDYAKALPFFLKKEGERLPVDDNTYDTAVLSLVLHHANNPIAEFDEVLRVTKGNIVIVETISGIEEKESPTKEIKRLPQFYRTFHSLDHKRQVMYGIFWDWFLNKMILSNDINCPFNFNTHKSWLRLFEDRGLTLVHEELLGIDQPVLPEYHVLYVLSNE